MAIQGSGPINALSPLIYEGSTPNLFIKDRIPTGKDFHGYELGSFWLIPEIEENDADLWVLVSKQFNIAVWKRLYLNPIEDNDVVTIETFTTPGAGTWTPKKNMRQSYVEIVAGGGSGASGISSIPNQPGVGSGGGGAYCAKLFTAAELGETVSYTIGAGGLSIRTPGNHDGVDGEDSVFGSPALMTASKGTGAILTSVYAPSDLSGNGGIGTGGDIIYNGFDGITGDTTGGQAPFPVAYTSTSGGSFYGTRIFFYGAGHPDIGRDGSAGGGGGSAAEPFNGAQLYGGNGGDGLMIITQYRN